MDKLLALDEVMTTLLRIKNEGLEFVMALYYTTIDVKACNTVCCVAGWYDYLNNGVEFDDEVRDERVGDWAKTIRAAVAGGDQYSTNNRSLVYMKVWELLFGAHRPDDVDKQIYVTRWFIAREERLREYNRIQALPKRERRLLDLAA